MMRLELTSQFLRQYDQLSGSHQRGCEQALAALPDAFGHPHQHAGLGIRAIRRGVYECRVSQSVRIGFTRHDNILLLHTVGTHDAIRLWLKSGL